MAFHLFDTKKTVDLVYFECLCLTGLPLSSSSPCDEISSCPVLGSGQVYLFWDLCPRNRPWTLSPHGPDMSHLTDLEQRPHHRTVVTWGVQAYFPWYP
jgi:hypothetical protein